MAKCQKNEVIGKTATDLAILTPEAINAIMLKADSYGNVTNAEANLMAKNGDIKRVLISAENINVQDKKYRFTVVHDITERRQIEETLQNERLLLRMLIDNIPYQIYYKDIESRFVFCNPAVAHNCGANTTDEMIGKTDFNFFPQHLAKQYFDDEQSIMQSGISLINHEEVCTYKMSDDIRWNLTTKVPLIDSNGLVKGLIGINRDITDRKKAEAEIKLKNEELYTANFEKDKFFSIIAHDLRSPFNVFLGFTRIMVEDLDNMTLEQIIKIVVSMRKSATNLYCLLENLLEWSMMQRGVITYTPVSILLALKIKEIIELIIGSVQKKGIEISYNIPDGLSVFADLHMVESIINNLITNAVKYTPKGGKICLSAYVLGDKTVEISIKDTGIGMNKNMIDNLFNLDERTNRKGTEGEPTTGLGLIICKEFIEKHGGMLWMESEVGKGSTFYFTLTGSCQ